MSTKSFFAALALALAAGCGAGGSTQQSHVDLANFIVPDFSEPKPDMAKMCVSSCSSDIQCQNSCAAPSSGISCCDTSTHTCYTNSQSVCPAPPDMAIPSTY